MSTDKKYSLHIITNNNPILKKQELIRLSIHSLIMIELQTEIAKTNFKLKTSKTKTHENN